MTFDLSMLSWQKNADGMLPVVIQDAGTGQVLMLGYMNEAALQATLATGEVTFYSRSKKRLWRKGETSGNSLTLVAARRDCDGDAILLQVRPSGPTCHTGARSCFGDGGELAWETIGKLMKTIQERSKAGPAWSYTAQLLRGGVDAYGAKVLEEAGELVRAVRCEGRRRTIEEAADLLYHLLVLLRGEGVAGEEVAQELRRRRKG